MLQTEDDNYVISFQDIISYEIKQKNGEFFIFDPPDQDSNHSIHDIVGLPPVSLGPPLSQGHHGSGKQEASDETPPERVKELIDILEQYLNRIYSR